MMTKVGKHVYKGPWLRIGIRGMEFWNGRAWLSMDTEEAWGFMAMMRGPDNSNTRLKELTTSRVRGLFCDYSRHPAILPPWMDYPIVRIPSRLSVTQKADLNRLLAKVPDHFRRHWAYAERNVIAMFHKWPYPATPKKVKDTKHR